LYLPIIYLNSRIAKYKYLLLHSTTTTPTRVTFGNFLKLVKKLAVEPSGILSFKTSIPAVSLLPPPSYSMAAGIL
jgi:hypothetical protein